MVPYNNVTEASVIIKESVAKIDVPVLGFFFFIIYHL